MALPTTELLDGETVLLQKAANAIIIPSDHGLSRFVADGLMHLVGMKDKEAIGGHLYLTTYRLLFKAHAINRLRGQFSIYLPTITEIKDTSRFISKKMQVHTQTHAYEFVIWGIPAVMDAIRAAQSQMTPAHLETLKYRLIHSGDLQRQFGVNEWVEGANVAITLHQRIETLLENGQDPLQLAELANLIELLQEKA